MPAQAADLSAHPSRALSLAVRHINASIPRPCSEAELLTWLRCGAAPADRAESLRAFFDETDTATLQDLVLSDAVTYAQLADLADRLLPAHHDTRQWLDERRAF